MRESRILVASILAGLIGVGACRAQFNAANYADMDSLFKAALGQYKGKHYDNAAKAFERLTVELPARDPRVPISFFYLGKSQEKTVGRLLAAKSYSRIYEQFPEDTLADDGLYLSGLAYKAMWRKPELDAEYGSSALTQFQTLQALYPNSPFSAQAAQQVAVLDQAFATKDYLTGTHYLKRKAYDSAIIYFKDVIRLHPSAPRARDAYLRLHQAYLEINYKDDARDLCNDMRKAYPSDRDVLRECGPAPPATASQ
ncbi:MAG TPA: outer membrane protein assembly factor BamD [Gemmatimonadaceae bacterium]|nr:outer membrane protein assembly factor BamD [Gemmatimonadaceae bacterium]